MKNPGKAKCEVMKEIRKQIAAANDIEYKTRECKFQGECSGTCPLCEQELAYLTEEIRKRKAAGMTVDLDAFKRYQEEMQNAECRMQNAESSNTKSKHKALKAAVVAAAATLGVSALSSCNPFQRNGDMRPVRLEGEVAVDTNEIDNPVMGEVAVDSTDTICQKAKAEEEPVIEELEGDVPMEVMEKE